METTKRVGDATDEEIMTILSGVEQKYGSKLFVPCDGYDPVFTARMARLADDMGITVLNPEFEPVIAAHRAALARFAPNVAPPMPTKRALRKFCDLAFSGIQRVKVWAN